MIIKNLKVLFIKLTVSFCFPFNIEMLPWVLDRWLPTTLPWFHQGRYLIGKQLITKCVYHLFHLLRGFLLIYTHMNTITFAHTYVSITYTFLLLWMYYVAQKLWCRILISFLLLFFIWIVVLVDVLGMKIRTSEGANFRSRVIANSLHVYELVQYDSSSLHLVIFDIVILLL